MEVDLVVDRPGKRSVFIEIKSADSVFAVDFSALGTIVRDTDAEAYVLSNDPSVRIESGIHFLSWRKGMAEILDKLM